MHVIFKDAVEALGESAYVQHYRRKQFAAVTENSAEAPVFDEINIPL